MHGQQWTARGGSAARPGAKADGLMTITSECGGSGHILHAIEHNRRRRHTNDNNDHKGKTNDCQGITQK